jgi:hypothetical protein
LIRIGTEEEVVMILELVREEEEEEESEEGVVEAIWAEEETVEDCGREVEEVGRGSLGSVALYAARASSNERPANFPPGAMQNSVK